MRCLYADLDGTLLGPDASLIRGADGHFSLDSVRALQACDRAGVEVVLYSGRRQQSVFDAARLIGQRSYIFELGCGLVLDGELEWLTDGVVPGEGASIYDQIEASGAPELLLDHFDGRLEYHTPWATGREVSHLFRGAVDLDEVASLLDAAGFGWLRLVDNGVISVASERLSGLPRIHAYHLIPSGSSKARAVARHMQNRGYAPRGVHRRRRLEGGHVGRLGRRLLLAGGQRAGARSLAGRRSAGTRRRPGGLGGLRRRGLRGRRDHARRRYLIASEALPVSAGALACVQPVMFPRAERMT